MALWDGSEGTSPESVQATGGVPSGHINLKCKHRAWMLTFGQGGRFVTQKDEVAGSQVTCTDAGFTRVSSRLASPGSFWKLQAAVRLLSVTPASSGGPSGGTRADPRTGVPGATVPAPDQSPPSSAREFWSQAGSHRRPACGLQLFTLT